MHFVFYALGSVCLAAIGQLLFKMGLATGGDSASTAVLSRVIAQLLTSPILWLGLLCYGGSTVLWLMALSMTQLNKLYPFTALTFALVMILSGVVLKEPLTWVSMIGFVVIVFGLYIVEHG